MQKLQPYEGLALRVQRGGISADGILKLISMIVPPEAVLNEISLEQEAASLTLKGVVGGNKNNADRVLSGFMHNIESSPFLTQPQIIASQGDGKTNTFEIKCNLAY
jgi:Tfp pilus assembly protein PilN